MDISLADISSVVGAVPLDGAMGTVRATGMNWDSRAIVPGDLFVALVGERVDGHNFAAAAVDSGAIAVLATRSINVGVPVIVVKDALRALRDLAAYWRNCITSTVLGVTGSSGKTTIKNLISDVLSCEHDIVATKANQNNELGVSATLLAANTDTQIVVIEMGMRGEGQIAELAEIALPNWGLVSNVGASHIELLGSREAIAHAKAELYEALPEGRGLAFVNADDEFAYAMYAQGSLEERGVQAIFFGVEMPHHRAVFSSGGENKTPVATGKYAIPPGSPFVWASDVSLDEKGCPSFTLNAVGFEQIELPDSNGSNTCTMQLLGIHNVSNACAAAAIGLASGMSLASCCTALEAARPVAGRQRMIKTPNGITVIDDAYNANPDSMAAALETFSAVNISGRRFAVLGDMLELGSYADACHERIGELVAAVGVDVLICVGTLSSLIASSARSSGMADDHVFVCENADTAFEILEEQLQPGDAVLVKASHSIGLTRIVEGLID